MTDRQDFYRRVLKYAPMFAKDMGVTEKEAIRRILAPERMSAEEVRGQWDRRQRERSARALEEARKIPPKVRQQVFEEADWTCVYCGDEATEIDHVLPVSRGGNRRRRNLAAACLTCNRDKVVFTPEEWRANRERRGLSWPPEPYLFELIAEARKRGLI